MANRYTYVNWQQYDQFKGTWDLDFRTLLDALKSTDPAEREQVRETLSQWPYEILDQIGRLGAVPLVLECLIDLLDSPETKERGQLLALVIRFVRDSKDFAKFSVWYSGSSDQLITSIRLVFDAGETLYLKLLDSDDPKLRAASAEALGLIGTSSLTNPLIKRLHVEHDDLVCQSIVVALRVCGTFDIVPDLLRQLASSNEPLKEATAATVCKLIGSVYFHSLGILADLVTIGIDVENSKEESVELMQTRVMSSAIEDLRALGEFALEWAVDWLLKKVPNVAPNNIIPFFRRIVMATFPMNVAIRQPIRTALLPLQRKVLTAIERSDTFWNTEEFVHWRHAANQSLANAEYYRSRCLEEIGVPANRDELRRFLVSTVEGASF